MSFLSLSSTRSCLRRPTRCEWEKRSGKPPEHFHCAHRRSSVPGLPSFPVTCHMGQSFVLEGRSLPPARPTAPREAPEIAAEHYFFFPLQVLHLDTFEGFKMDITKPVSNNFAMLHTLSMK